MKPLRILSRRSLIKVVSFVTAAFVVTVCLAVGGYALANRYRNVIEYNYTRALDDLGYYARSMQTALTKGMYVGTNAQFLLLSSQLASDASQAKDCLSQLPQSGVELTDSYRFLSQVGEYAMSLTQKVSEGGRVTEAEWDNLRSLAGYADAMAQEVDMMRSIVLDEDFINGEVKRAMEKEEQDADEQDQAQAVNADGSSETGEADETASGEQAQSIGGSFDKLEKGFDGYPSLIYDGPFSDQMQSRESTLLQGLPEIDIQTAAQTAARVSAQPVGSIGGCSQEESRLASYCFGNDTVTVAVSRAGGYPVYMTVSRALGAETVSAEQAVENAKNWLVSIGYTGMSETYYMKNNGVCTINFAYKFADTLVYTDLIKVCVALDNGAVCGFDARNYLMNHHEREVPQALLSRAEGLQSVSPKLSVVSARRVIIPSSGGEQLACYEYNCRGQDNERVLVYINLQTGAEEQILILIEDENGTLTM